MNENTAETIKSSDQGTSCGPKNERMSVKDTLLIVEMFELIRTLYNDVDFYSDQVFETDIPMMRRSYARALFAFIEGSVWAIKWLCVNVGEYDASIYTPQEMYILAEREVKPQVDGTRPRDENLWFREEPMKISLHANLQFAFGMYAKMIGATYSTDKSGSGWAQFKRAVEIRDRLMHPKHITHLFVTDAEVEILLDAQEWFRSTFIELFVVVDEQVRKVRPDIEIMTWPLFEFSNEG